MQFQFASDRPDIGYTVWLAWGLAAWKLELALATWTIASGWAQLNQLLRQTNVGTPGVL